MFGKSIAALQRLNALGYGKPGSGLALHLVYNPQGPRLPGPQAGLQSDYQRELKEAHGVVFNELYTLVNMPIQRFGSTLISKGQFNQYMQLLQDSFNAANLESVMCKDLISVDWQGFLYDCDFNQQLGLPLGAAIGEEQRKRHLRELLRSDFAGSAICVADHCYGCTAGQGSSCGGALQ